MFERRLGFTRMPCKEIDINQISKMQNEIKKPSLDEFKASISPIWEKVIATHGSDISKLLNTNEPSVIKGLFENFFVNGLSDGAAVGDSMKNLRTVLKIKGREHKRLNKLLKITAAEKLDLNFNLYDFGQPWLLKTSYGILNFEITDHYYFAILIKKYVQESKIDEAIFLGDGCGYLAQCLLELDKNQLINKVIFIDLYHFLCRQYLLLNNTKECHKIEFFNAEANEYKTDSNEKILINQDSLPEISQAQQDKYFNFMRNNNVRALVSYNKIDGSLGHVEFRKQADSLFSKKILCKESEIRKGYWLEIWHDL